MPYAATLDDELHINIGDLVTISHHYYDGWCFGTNLSTGLSGSFPVACTYPLAPTRFVLVILSDLSADVIGSDIVQGAELAYPSLFQTERFNSLTLTKEKLEIVLDTVPINDNSTCIVCGPPGMSARVVDMVTELGNGWADNLKVLNSENPN